VTAELFKLCVVEVFVGELCVGDHGLRNLGSLKKSQVSTIEINKKINNIKRCGWTGKGIFSRKNIKI
jgi:hypothetical protein